MTRQTLVATLLLGLAVSGCTGTAGVTAGANASASAAPTSGASTAPGSLPAVANGVFAVGRKWNYDFGSKAAGTNTTGTMVLEVTNVANNKATVTSTVTMPGLATQTTSSTVDVTKPDFASVGQKNSTSQTVVSTTQEAITVKAGAFKNAVKTIYSFSESGAAGTTTQWVDPAVGMLKTVTEVKPPSGGNGLPAGFPANIPGLPAGGLDLSSTTTIELTSYTK